MISMKKQRLSSHRRTKVRFQGYQALLEHSLEEASKLVMLQPQHGQTKSGRPKSIYIHTLLEDTLTTIRELITAMLDQSDWRAGESWRAGA